MSTPTTNPDAYNAAREHAEAGRYEQALQHVRDHLVNEPNDTEALNDAGAILYAMGRYDEAIDHLQAAAKTDQPAAVETLLNLAEVHLAANRPEEALPLLPRLAEEDCLSPDLAVRLSTALLDKGLTPQAVEALAILKRLYPDAEDQVAESALAVVRNHRPKVSFFYLAEEERMTDPIRDFLADRFELRWSSEQDAERLQELMTWSDVAWFESCDSMFAVASQNPGYARLVCHMKMYKASNPWIDEVDWSNVAVLIVPDPSIAERICERVEGLGENTRIVVVPNGVSLELLEEFPRQGGTHACCIGLDNFRLQPKLTELIGQVKRDHPELDLSITPESPEDRFTGTDYLAFEKQVAAAGAKIDPIQGNPLEWLEDKQYVLATNHFAERTPLVAECLAVGIKPLVYVPEGDTPGPLAERFGWTTPAELEQRLFHEPWNPKLCRQIAEEHYSYAAHLARLNDVMLEMEQAWLDDQPPQPGPSEAAQASQQD